LVLGGKNSETEEQGDMLVEESSDDDHGTKRLEKEGERATKEKKYQTNGKKGNEPKIDLTKKKNAEGSRSPSKETARKSAPRQRTSSKSGAKKEEDYAVHIEYEKPTKRNIVIPGDPFWRLPVPEDAGRGVTHRNDFEAAHAEQKYDTAMRGSVAAAKKVRKFFLDKTTAAGKQRVVVWSSYGAFKAYERFTVDGENPLRIPSPDRFVEIRGSETDEGAFLKPLREEALNEEKELIETKRYYTVRKKDKKNKADFGAWVLKKGVNVATWGGALRKLPPSSMVDAEADNRYSHPLLGLFVIDALPIVEKKIAGVEDMGHMFRHSTTPNCEISYYPINSDKSSLGCLMVVRSVKLIEQGAELTVDYRPEYGREATPSKKSNKNKGEKGKTAPTKKQQQQQQQQQEENNKEPKSSLQRVSTKIAKKAFKGTGNKIIPDSESDSDDSTYDEKDAQ